MSRRIRDVSVSLMAAAALASFVSPVLAQPAEQFYQGKTVRIIVALGTGGSYDAYARLVGRNLGKHIPGNPSVVVENMPGAGGLIAANHVYKVAQKDGTVLGALHQTTTLAQVTSTPNVEYDARKFNWIGRVASGGSDVHYTFAGKGPKTFEELFQREIVVAGGGPTSMSVILPSAVNSLMGGKLKILSGFKGTAETNLAVERGEVDMALENWEELRVQRADLLKDKKINLIVQYQLKRHPELPDLPTIMEKAKTDEQRQIWSVMLQPATFGHTFNTGPEVPADRVAVLRKAFDAMAKDPALKADADKAKLGIAPMTGAQVAEIVEAVFKVDAGSIEKAKKILGR